MLVDWILNVTALAGFIGHTWAPHATFIGGSFVTAFWYGNKATKGW